MVLKMQTMRWCDLGKATVLNERESYSRASERWRIS